MSTLHMDVEATRGVQRAMAWVCRQMGDRLQGTSTALGRLGMAWEGPAAQEFLQEAERWKSQMGRFLDELAQLSGRLEAEIDEWERMAAGVGGKAEPNAVVVGYPHIPTRLPAEPSDPGVIGFLDDWLKPLDWVANHKAASKKFHDAMKQVGRWLNRLLGTRGYIKKLDALAGVMEGSAKAIGGLGDPMALRDFGRYFAGEITNQEIARAAIKALIPIPRIDDRVADWLIHNFVEQRNSHLVRNYLGYMRLDSVAQTRALNRIYDPMWLYGRGRPRPFQPVLRLVEKEMLLQEDGSYRVRYHHDRARTPLERLFETGVLSPQSRQYLETLYDHTNPRLLRQAIYDGIE